MAKFSVTGADAGAVLDHLSAGDVNGEPGWITYTQWLNDDGRIEADLTVSKLADDRFWVVASDTAHGHVRGLLQRAAYGRDVRIEDVTRDVGQLNLQGPLSREVLATLTDADLSTEAWPFRGVREIEVAGVPVTCARITYLGELGYELYVAADRALELYDAMAADSRVRPVGLKALASLRMEKAYRDFGHDIDNTDCPLDVGLGFAVAWDTDFRGKEALLARKAIVPVDPAAGADPAQRPRAAAVPRRAGAPGRRGGRLRPRRVVRVDARRRRRARLRLRRRAGHQGLAGRRRLGGRHRRRAPRRRGVAAADVRPDHGPGVRA